jgi:hypothetical protein
MPPCTRADLNLITRETIQSGSFPTTPGRSHPPLRRRCWRRTGTRRADGAIRFDNNRAGRVLPALLLSAAPPWQRPITGTVPFMHRRNLNRWDQLAGSAATGASPAALSFFSRKSS